MSAARFPQQLLPGHLLQCMHNFHMCKVPTVPHFGERNMSAEQPCSPIPWHGLSLIILQVSISQ